MELKELSLHGAHGRAAHFTKNPPGLRDNLVAEISLNGALCNMDAADMAPFSTIVNVKLVKASAFIRSSHQLGMGPRGIRDDVHSVALRRAFPVDILAAGLPCLK